MGRALSLLLLLLISLTLQAQKDVPYFETIEGDSVRLFLESSSLFGSSRTTFTSKDCAGGYRVVRIASNGKFEGSFADIMLMGKPRKPVLMAHGTYMLGKKQGPFVFYYPDGKVKTEGQFHQDEPIGEWQFNSPDGVLVMVLRFDTNGEGRIWYMYDDKAQLVLVKDGNGEARFVSQGETPYNISGKVRSGLPEGEWIGEVSIWMEVKPSGAGRKLSKRGK